MTETRPGLEGGEHVLRARASSRYARRLLARTPVPSTTPRVELQRHASARANPGFEGPSRPRLRRRGDSTANLRGSWSRYARRTAPAPGGPRTRSRSTHFHPRRASRASSSFYVMRYDPRKGRTGRRIVNRQTNGTKGFGGYAVREGKPPFAGSPRSRWSGKRSLAVGRVPPDRVAFASATHPARPRRPRSHPADVDLAVFALSSERRDRLARRGARRPRRLRGRRKRAPHRRLIGEGAALSALRRATAPASASGSRPRRDRDRHRAHVDTTSLEPVGVLPAPLSRPSLHEIRNPPDRRRGARPRGVRRGGTFARVVGFAGDEVSAVPGARSMRAGSRPASSASRRTGTRSPRRGRRAARTHAWPTLHELSSVPLADDFVSSFSGAVGDDIFVDGDLDADAGNAVMVRPLPPSTASCSQGRRPASGRPPRRERDRRHPRAGDPSRAHPRARMATAGPRQASRRGGAAGNF